MKAPFSFSPRLRALWPLGLQASAELTLSKLYDRLQCEAGGNWGRFTDQEWVEQFAVTVRTSKVGSAPAKAAQAILESGYARQRVLLGIKARPQDLTGRPDPLFGIPNFHPEGKAGSFGTNEFDGAGNLYGTSASFITGTISQQFQAYDDLIRRVHPDAVGMRGAWCFLHYICRPAGPPPFRYAYSTAPWIDPNTGAAIPSGISGTWPFDKAWMMVQTGKAVSLYAKTCNTIIQTLGLEIFG